MANAEKSAPITRTKDGRSWLVGDFAEVAWIADHTTIGVAITSAIPPIFEAYATVVVPDLEQRAGHERAVLDVLSEQSTDEPWWLGYLDTGADDVVFSDAPKVTFRSGWRYVLVQAGPEQAARWKDRTSWRGGLPDLIFPLDRSWLVSTLWDDDWRCVGGSAELIAAFRDDSRLETRSVSAGVDATPPGHQAR